jgi:hypothetical protein
VDLAAEHVILKRHAKMVMETDYGVSWILIRIPVGNYGGTANMQRGRVAPTPTSPPAARETRRL